MKWERSLLYYRRVQNQESYKWPKNLEKVLEREEKKEAKFASFRFDSAETRNWLLIKIIVGVLLYILFPLWPYSVKYGIYIVVYYLLVVLVGVLILRLVLYLAVAISGGSFWLFPKMTDDDVDILKSFSPIYSF